MVTGCKQKMSEGLISFVCNLTLTYGKQRSHFEFLAIWLIRALCLNISCYYFGFGPTTILNLRQYGGHRGNFKTKFEFVIVIARPFVNMAAKGLSLNVTCYYYWSDVNKTPF
jgi:hypothetical protein